MGGPFVVFLSIMKSVVFNGVFCVFCLWFCGSVFTGLSVSIRMWSVRRLESAMVGLRCVLACVGGWEGSVFLCSGV